MKEKKKKEKEADLTLPIMLRDTRAGERERERLLLEMRTTGLAPGVLRFIYTMSSILETPHLLPTQASVTKTADLA